MFGLGGSLSPDTTQTVAPGSIVRFDIFLRPGFTILGVSGCDGELDGKVYTTGSIQTHCKVHATFMPSNETFVLTYAPGDHGRLAVDDEPRGWISAKVISGGAGPVVAAVADAGYSFRQWSDGSTANPRIDTSVIDDLAVTAQFHAL